MKKLMVGLMILVLAMCMVGVAADNYVMQSGTVLWQNPSAAVDGGALIDLGNRYGVALGDVASNETGAVRTDGVFDFLRAETNAITMDMPLYYSAAGTISVTVVADKYVGSAVEVLDDISAITFTNGTVNKVKVDMNAFRRPIGLAAGAGSATGTFTVVEGQVTVAD